MSAIELSFQHACACTNTPQEQQFQHWADQAAPQLSQDIDVCLRIVDIDEMTTLNEQYRSKKGPTNVLTFIAEIPAEVDSSFAGDIVICAEVVEREAKAQNKEPHSHWAHLLIHGLLHILSYDHICDADAIKMEALETQLVTGLGYPPPYTHAQEIETTHE